MTVEPAIVWNIIITLIIVPAGWYLANMAKEVQRIQILLNMTREDYMKRSEHSEETDRVLDHLRRLEDKVDRLIEKK